MKKCPQCQKTFSDETKFCSACGAELETVEETAAKTQPQATAEAQPQEEQGKKKTKMPLILALCGVLVLGVLVGLIAANIAGKDDSEPKQETSAKKDSNDDQKDAAKKLKDKAGDKSDKQDQKDDKKSGDNFYQAEWCSFSYPEEWAGKVRIEEDAYDKIRVISISMDEKNEYGFYPLLYAIELSDYPYTENPPASGDQFYYNPGYRETLGVSTTGVYAHLVGPTDVQFDPGQQADYDKLVNANLQTLRDTFKFDY